MIFMLVQVSGVSDAVFNDVICALYLPTVSIAMDIYVTWARVTFPTMHRILNSIWIHCEAPLMQ